MHFNIRNYREENKPSQETEKALVKQEEKQKSSVPGSQVKKAFLVVISS